MCARKINVHIKARGVEGELPFAADHTSLQFVIGESILDLFRMSKSYLLGMTTKE